MGFYIFLTIIALLADFYLSQLPELSSSVTIIILMIVLYRLHKLSDLLQGGEDED